MKVGVWTTPGGCESAHCIRVKLLENGSVLVGSTMEPGDLLFTAAEWDAFIAGVKDGEFDNLA